MRIVHLSVCRKFSRGQINQLHYEYSASQKLEGVEWKTLGYHTEATESQFIKRIPAFFRPLFLRNLYGWLVALRLSKEYDILIMRHMTFDPFALIFAPFVSNRISVHHSKEVEELKLVKAGWRGRLASLFEQHTGRVAVKNTKMILGVTEEIAKYEKETRAPNKPVAVYSNGIDVVSIKKLKDARETHEVHAAFICGNFSSWHGLDKLIQAVDDDPLSFEDIPLFIHLIGQLSPLQLKEIRSTERRAKVFRAYGVMDFSSYSTILEKCDFGLASLALERKKLGEASTLKIREMLALGLPVYSGHRDIALSKDYRWSRIVDKVDLRELYEFGVSMKEISRCDVRSESSIFIDKLQIMKDVIEVFRKL